MSSWSHAIGLLGAGGARGKGVGFAALSRRDTLTSTFDGHAGDPLAGPNLQPGTAGQTRGRLPG